MDQEPTKWPRATVGWCSDVVVVSSCNIYRWIKVTSQRESNTNEMTKESEGSLIHSQRHSGSFEFSWVTLSVHLLILLEIGTVKVDMSPL